MNIYSKTNLPANFLLCDYVDSVESWRYEWHNSGMPSCLDFFECFPENCSLKVKAFEFESEEKCNELFIKLINLVPHSIFEDIASAKEFLDENEFPCGCVLCGKKFTDEFLSCFEPNEIFRTSLIDDDTAFLFSFPQFVGAMPNNSTQFGMVISNKNCFCRILKKENKMIPKEKDLHNLFTPDQKQHKDLEKCSLEDATIIMIKGKKFTLGETFEKHGVFELDSIKLRVEFDRYTDEIDVRDFDLFGIECYKPKEHKPVIFTTKVIEHSIREVDNHGMIYDALDSVCVILPDQFIECLDKEVEVTVKVK